MDTGVGHRRFPVGQEAVLLGQTGEGAAAQGIALGIGNSAFDLALMPRGVGACGERDRAVMPAEGLDLGIQLRVVPVSPGDGRLEVVDHQGPGHAAANGLARRNEPAEGSRF